MTKKCVIYARQSFGSEEGSVSIDVQISACKAWADRNNINIIGIFQDANTSSELYPACTEGIEAARVDRGFQKWKKEQITKGRKQYKEDLGKCFDLIKAEKPDFILIYTSNRLGRSATNSNLNNFITAYLMEYNCSIVDVQNNSVTDFSDKLMMAFRAMKDALDYQGLAEKRKASIDAINKRINSHKVWSNAYGVIMQAGSVVFDPEKADVVRCIYNGILEGTSYNGILTVLNKQYRQLAIGRQFYMTNIYEIASNIVYCGYSRDREGNIDKAVNTPSPIITYTQWQEVQRIMQERKNKAVKYNTKGEGKHWLPYSGMLYCECGRKLTMQIDRGSVAYQCINGNADGEHVSRIKVDDNFINSLQSLFMISAIRAEKDLFSMRNASNQSDEIRAKITGAEQALKAKMRMIESDEDYELFKDEIRTKKEEIKSLKSQLLEQEAKQSENLDALTETIMQDFQAIASGNTLEKTTYQRLLSKTISKITVFSEKLTVTLIDGISFDLPRIKTDNHGKAGRKSKTIPASQMTLLVKPSGLHTTYVTFGDGDNYKEIKGEGYTIRIAE